MSDTIYANVEAAIALLAANLDRLPSSGFVPNEPLSVSPIDVAAAVAILTIETKR